MNTPLAKKVSIHWRITWGILLALAFYSLAEAAWSAFRTGSVQVISVGWNRSAREMVTWQAGWARFAGPLALAWACFLWQRDRRASAPAVLVTCAAFLLIFFSYWFTNLRLILIAVGFHVYIVAALVVGNKYGSFAVLLMTGMLAIIALWVAA